MHAFFEGKKAGEAYARKSGSWNVEVGSPTVIHEPELSTAYENRGAIFRRVSLPFLRLHPSLIIQPVRTVPRES
jgi:hypothetical protein